MEFSDSMGPSLVKACRKDGCWPAETHSAKTVRLMIYSPKEQLGSKRCFFAVARFCLLIGQ